jgi:hypothetical protein
VRRLRAAYDALQPHVPAVQPAKWLPLKQ